MKVIVEASNRCIEDQDIIDRILTHLRGKEATENNLARLPAFYSSSLDGCELFDD